MSENTLETSFGIVSEKLVALAKEQGVMAAPIEVGDTSVIPISELKVGFGGGGGEGVGQGDMGAGQCGQGKGVASGGFGGVRISPVAFIVVNGDEITLETMDEEGGAK